MKRALLLATLLVSGCADIVLPDDPGTDAVTAFDALWHEVDAHYASFDVKRVDWDSVYDVYRPQVQPDMTGSALFGVASRMLETLRDGHVTLVSPTGTAQYSGWRSNYPSNFAPVSVPLYLADGGERSMTGRMWYGLLTPDIGYVYIGEFSGDGWPAGFDAVLRSMRGIDALVVDVRSNGGGTDSNAEAIAGRLTDSTRAFMRVRYRDGPARDDFGPWATKRITPQGERFTGPIAVLANRATFSAAESFVLSLSLLPHAIVIGDTTGGGFSSPYWRELPNGWSVRIPRWQAAAMDGTSYEDVGFPPDIAVQFQPGDAQQGRDRIIERAVLELSRAPSRTFVDPSPPHWIDR